MSKQHTRRQKALVRRRLFLAACALILAVLIFLIYLAATRLFGSRTPKNPASSAAPSSSQPQSSVPSASSGQTVSSAEPITAPAGLDPEFSNLLLVNGSHPLPENYDYEKDLIRIPNEYLNNTWFQQIGGQIDRSVWPYMKAMIDAAWADGVKLYVWSPYRSYSTQNDLFQKQVERQKAKGLSGQAAEDAAATVVARPGTSEHHTGLAADFNMADDKFESTEMFRWMQEHAADYGFIMRYSGEKEPLTGVIHESWHYRFVGIRVAKEIKSLGLCLEEYLDRRPNNE